MNNGKINLNNNVDWISFEDQFPEPFLEVLLFSPEGSYGNIRVGYYDPDNDRIAIATIALDTLRLCKNKDYDDITSLEIADRINNTNPDFSRATHWKYIDDMPFVKNTEMSAADILDQTQKVNQLKRKEV